MRLRPSTASASKATKEEGVSLASLATREAGGMQAKLQRVEVQAARRGNHDLAVEHAT